MLPKELLKKFSFSENEAIVYLAIFQLGNTQVGNIIQFTALPRATVYDTIDRLVKGWYLFRSEKYNITQYGASDPNIFLSRIHSSIDELEQKSRLFENNISNIVKLKQSFFRLPIIRTYEGFEGIREVLDESLEAKETIYAYVNIDAMKQTVNDIVQIYVKKRVQKKVKARWLVLKTQEAERIMARYDASCTEFRWFPETSIPHFDLELSVYDGKVVYMTYRDTMPIAVVVEDIDIYRLHRATFEALWSQSEE